LPLFVISGPSGAGKGTLVREILADRPDLVLSVSATTRPARQGEVHGKDYIFLNRQEFLGMRDRGEFLEWAEVYKNLYGTPREQVERNLASGRSTLLELDIQGAQSVKRTRPDAILIFIEPPSLDDLYKRLKGRGTEDAETMSRRIQAAYEEMKIRGTYEHIVVNDEVRRAADELLRIIEQELKGRP
jgi:guanylate kinase